MTTEIGKQSNCTNRGERFSAKKNALCSECSSSFAGMCTRILLHFELKMHSCMHKHDLIFMPWRTRELLQYFLLFACWRKSEVSVREHKRAISQPSWPKKLGQQRFVTNYIIWQFFATKKRAESNKLITT